MQLMRSFQRRASMRGLSLVELMVGIAVSLFIVAAAALLTSTQLTENRRLLLETQLQQDLRATADIVTRELRRSSFWNNAPAGVPAPSGGAVVPNAFEAVTLNTSGSSEVIYRYWRSSGAEVFGFRLNNAGVVQSCQTDGSEALGPCTTVPWQDLTDGRTMEVTNFQIDDVRAGLSANDDLVTLPCPTLCSCPAPCLDPLQPTACWPKVGVREFTVQITARSRAFPEVQRTLTSSVRVRNDRVVFSTEAAANSACPAS